MGARTKLNAAYFNGCLFLAALFGLITQSWTAFTIALAILLAGCVYSGEIRTTGRGR